MTHQHTVIEDVRELLDTLNDARPADDVLSLLATQLMQWLKPDDVIIGRHDAAAQTFSICAVQGARACADAESLLAPGLQALARAQAANTPLLYPCSGAFFVPDQFLDTLSAVLAVPLSASDADALGGLLLYYADLPYLSAGDLELAALAGAQATLVLKQFRQKTTDYATVIMGERNRIARDLHDSVTQALYTISLITETLPAVWQSHREEALHSVDTLHTLARSALAEMRTLLLELRPSDQVDRNLGDLLRQLPDRMRPRSKVQIATTVVGDTPLPKHVQVALYYIAQEALNNVDKHACASRASVQLDFRPNGVVALCVGDNGRGINPAEYSANQLGLNIMRERAAEIGATFAVESKQNQGTRVIVEWQADN